MVMAKKETPPPIGTKVYETLPGVTTRAWSEAAFTARDSTTYQFNVNPSSAKKKRPVRSKYSDDLQVPMDTGLLQSCIAWISNEFDKDLSPYIRYRTHNRRPRYRIAAL